MARKLLLLVGLFILFQSPSKANEKEIEAWGASFIESIDFLDKTPIEPYLKEFCYAFSWRAKGDLENTSGWLLHIVENECWYASFLLGMEYFNGNFFPKDFLHALFWFEKAINTVNEPLDKANIAKLVSTMWQIYWSECPVNLGVELSNDFYQINAYCWLLIANFFDPKNNEMVKLYEANLDFGPTRIQKGKAMAEFWLKSNGYILSLLGGNHDWYQ